MGHGAHQALLRQTHQCLAHRGAPHIQVVAKLLDAQLFARLVVQVDDFASNGVVGLVLQARFLLADVHRFFHSASQPFYHTHISAVNYAANQLSVVGNSAVVRELLRHLSLCLRRAVLNIAVS